ncbi:MAG: 6,7-dimethyl-8-ribityllumazine synthase [Gammaproteobacteria bacterium]|nr:MAG: 6,7-dimethyl-8-ribityllumazine synthase [Gammaproteobacteria bacterium]RLA51681.1 MAG: 6,7-dimethyl-8-ribityllumazine synthase [Gammaproteobacteria bacterium]
MSEFRPVEGNFNPRDASFAIVVARWNGDITENLLNGALRAFARQGVPDDRLQVVRVPGAFELPLAAKILAEAGRVDAVLTLGCVIRGGTPHFEYVCSECARGVGEVALATGLPIAFGVLTTDDLRQAQDRSGDNKENKGEEAALCALEMVSLFQQLAD